MSRHVEVTIPVAGSVYRVSGSYEPMVPGIMRQGDGFRHTVDGGFWTDAVLVRLSGRTRRRSLVLDRAAMTVEGSLWTEAHRRRQGGAVIEYERDSEGIARGVPRHDPPSVIVECCCGHSWTEGPEFSIHEPIRCPRCRRFGCMQILKEVPDA